MKGVILAGGTGSRLHPLTRITNKHLLPIYDRPMISFAIEALVKGGITDIMLVTGGTHAGEFLRLLGNGHDTRVGFLVHATVHTSNPCSLRDHLTFPVFRSSAKALSK